MSLGEVKMYEFLQELEWNIGDEATARSKYFQLLANFKDFLSREEISLIEEIISEELKHSEILSDIIYRRTKIKPE